MKKLLIAIAITSAALFSANASAGITITYSSGHHGNKYYSKPLFSSIQTKKTQ